MVRIRYIPEYSIVRAGGSSTEGVLIRAQGHTWVLNPVTGMQIRVDEDSALELEILHSPMELAVRFLRRNEAAKMRYSRLAQRLRRRMPL